MRKLGYLGIFGLLGLLGLTDPPLFSLFALFSLFGLFSTNNRSHSHDRLVHPGQESHHDSRDQNIRGAAS